MRASPVSRIRSIYATQSVAVYLHLEPHQVRLICSWCMKRYLRRAAHMSAERLILVQTDEQTEINMETNMDVDIGDKSVYIRAREDSQSTSQRSIQSNTENA